MRPFIAVLSVVAFAALLQGILSWVGQRIPLDPEPLLTSQPSNPLRSQKLYAVGDIGVCGSDDDTQVAQYLQGQAGSIITLGDHAYQSGTQEEFRNCFLPIWEPLVDRTIPVLGNHDVVDPSFLGLRGAFPDATVAEDVVGYGAETYENLTLILLNSNCSEASCGESSAQGKWLRETLSDISKEQCVIVAMHHPRTSSTKEHGPNSKVEPLWQAIIDSQVVDLVLTGHDHVYERFAAIGASGAPSESGIPQYIVGTGGAKRYTLKERLPGSEFFANDSVGVLELLVDKDSVTTNFTALPSAERRDEQRVSC